MKLNKRQEAFLSIFGIAFAALVVDRAFLSRARGPAGAYGATEQAADELVLVPPAIPDATCQSPVMRLSARLEMLYAGRQFDAEHFREYRLRAITQQLEEMPEMVSAWSQSQ